MRAGELSGGRDAADRAAVDVGRGRPRLADAAAEQRAITARVLCVRREALAWLGLGLGLGLGLELGSVLGLGLGAAKPSPWMVTVEPPSAGPLAG